jgi:hypothetical protein
LNRFSTDIGTFEGTLMGCFGWVVNGLIFLSYLFITAAILHWSVIFFAIFLLFILFNINGYVGPVLTSLKSLDNIEKSPIYTEYKNTLNGMISIRCYK